MAVTVKKAVLWRKEADNRDNLCGRADGARRVALRLCACGFRHRGANQMGGKKYGFASF